MSNRRNANLTTQNKIQGKIKSKSDVVGKRQRAKKNKVREYTEAILVALLAAMFLRAFVIQAFRIPTGSMKDTLLVGDFLLVNKFIYGVRTPDRIPLINAKIPFFRLPAFKAPTNGDIVVFKYPKDEKLDYIKRCIAVGGQTLEIRNGDVYVDGKPEGSKVPLGREYDPEEGRKLEYTRITTPDGKSYVIRHHADHYLYDENHNYGPVVVPAKGATVKLNLKNLPNYERIIRVYEKNKLEVKSNKIYINGEEANSYTFKMNYYFMMGDNRDNSADSRVWGFLPEENVVGEALIIYFSWDKTSPLWNILNSVRWARIGDIIR
ncbi:MAG: signal peptidase I [bacterium]